jgi:hypothetical protein
VFCDGSNFFDVPVLLVLEEVNLSETCIGVDLSSFSKEFNSLRSPALPMALSRSLFFLPMTSLSAVVRLFRFVVCNLSFSEEEDVDESSSGGRVNRSNISGGNTAPNDKIRFPPLFALWVLEGSDPARRFGATEIVDAAAAADAGTGVGAVIAAATGNETESDEADESLP